MPETDQLEILEQRFWLVHWGGLLHPSGGVEGKLTKCRLGQVVFYVRENVALPGHGFNISAGERMAIKDGRLSKRHLQILELAALSGCWDEIAQFVHEADGLRRPVRRNARFTTVTAEQLLRECRSAS